MTTTVKTVEQRAEDRAFAAACIAGRAELLLGYFYSQTTVLHTCARPGCGKSVPAQRWSRHQRFCSRLCFSMDRQVDGIQKDEGE